MLVEFFKFLSNEEFVIPNFIYFHAKRFGFKPFWKGISLTLSEQTGDQVEQTLALLESIVPYLGFCLVQMWTWFPGEVNKTRPSLNMREWTLFRPQSTGYPELRFYTYKNSAFQIDLDIL